MITVSLCMIAKNDEAVIERCLNSISNLVDEIIIVDVNSTDRTRELASSFTNNIYSIDRESSDTEALSYAFQLATSPYIFWLNPNDVLHKDDRIKFIQLKQTIHPKIDGVMINVDFTKEKIRFVKKDSNYSFSGEPVDDLIVSGFVEKSDFTINHLPYTNNTKTNIQTYEKLLNEKIDFTPRDLFYYAKELCDDHQHVKAIKYFLKYLRSNQPFEEHNILACQYLADSYHYLELKDQEKSWLLQSLQYGKPQPETCCRIGYFYFENRNFESAVFWYKEAISYKHTNRLISYHQAYSTWLPHLQLAVCYDRIGEYQLANDHNELAFHYNPTHASILANREYFSSMLNK